MITYSAYSEGICCRYIQKLYGDDSCLMQSLAENLQLAGVEGQMDSKLCSSGEGGIEGKDLPVCVCMSMIVGVQSMAVMLY